MRYVRLSVSAGQPSLPEKTASSPGRHESRLDTTQHEGQASTVSVRVPARLPRCLIWQLRLRPFESSLRAMRNGPAHLSPAFWVRTEEHDRCGTVAVRPIFDAHDTA